MSVCVHDIDVSVAVLVVDCSIISWIWKGSGKVNVVIQIFSDDSMRTKAARSKYFGGGGSGKMAKRF